MTTSSRHAAIDRTHHPLLRLNWIPCLLAIVDSSAHPQVTRKGSTQSAADDVAFFGEACLPVMASPVERVLTDDGSPLHLESIRDALSLVADSLHPYQAPTTANQVRPNLRPDAAA